jgi:elongation factor Ts
MAVTAAEVKALREKTGVGPAECKKALEESGGDVAKAEKLLKERGLAAAAKRADRATNQGKITIKQKGGEVVLVEATTETDFVARNPEFIALGEELAERALEKGFGDVHPELEEMVKALATKIRENMALRRVKRIKGGANQYIDTYIHGDGAIGVAVVVSADKADIFSTPELKEFAHDLSLHIAAFSPAAISKENINADAVKEQEELFRAQMASDEKLKDKPEKVLSGILKGKMDKWLADICLLDQKFVKDDKLTVAKALEAEGKKHGAALKIDEFVYFKVGG